MREVNDVGGATGRFGDALRIFGLTLRFGCIRIYLVLLRLTERLAVVWRWARKAGINNSTM